MTTATNLITLALKTAGVLGVGQAALPQDLADCLVSLNDMISDWNLERTVRVIPGTVPSFPDLTTDVGFLPGYENALLWNLSVRIRPLYGMPEDKQQSALAAESYVKVQAINRQSVAAAHGGQVETVQQMLFLALRMIGRVSDTQGVADTSQDVSDAFATLTMMLAQWQRKRWLIPNLAEVAFLSTGAEIYSIGADGDIPIARPDRIESAFARLGGGYLAVDYPLQVLSSQEDYNTIGFKALTSFPSQAYYEPSFPLGQLRVWPIPPAGQFEIHLFVKQQLQQFAAVTDALLVPPEYVEAMLYNLAVRLGLTFAVDVRPGIVAMAKATLNTVRNANIQVPELRMPDGMPPNFGIRGGGPGGIFGGVVYPTLGGIMGDFSPADFGPEFSGATP